MLGLCVSACMDLGPRSYKAASCSVMVPFGLPEECHGHIRELSSLRCTKQRKGYAGVLLHNICFEADMHANSLLVMVRQESEGLSLTDLVNFYAKRGFELLQLDPILMLRKPQPTRARKH